MKLNGEVASQHERLQDTLVDLQVGHTLSKLGVACFTD